MGDGSLMATDGRTIWWAKDVGWWHRERIIDLGEEFGADGPAVIDWLSGEAKAQNDGGRVKSGVKAISRGCFVDVVTVGHVLSRSVTLGLLDDFEGSDGLFTCRISGWQGDQNRGRAAFRQANKRARDGSTEPDPPPDDGGHSVTDRDVSRPVTASSIEKRRETTTTTASERACAHPDNLPAQILEIQQVFREFGPPGCEIDELSAAGVLARFPSAEHVQLAHGCAEYLRGQSDRPPGLTFHRFVAEEMGSKRGLRAVPNGERAKRFASERTDFSDYEGLESR
jgi:hypothetical protein